MGVLSVLQVFYMLYFLAHVGATPESPGYKTEG